MAREMLKDAWDDLQNVNKTRGKSIENKLKELEKKIGQLMERILECNSPPLIQAYEVQVKKLHQEKIIIQEQHVETDQSYRDFEETYRTALDFL